MTMPFAAFRNFAKAPTNNLVEAWTDYSLPQNTQTVSVAHPDSCSVGTGLFSGATAAEV
jgi:hypothetical protein